LSDFERGQIVGARLVGASETKIATLLIVSRVTVSKAMSATYTKTTSAKGNRERKSTSTERDRHSLRRIVSKNCRTTATQGTGQQN
jgi:hypothetical protein